MTTYQAGNIHRHDCDTVNSLMDYMFIAVQINILCTELMLMWKWFHTCGGNTCLTKIDSIGGFSSFPAWISMKDEEVMERGIPKINK